MRSAIRILFISLAALTGMAVVSQEVLKTTNAEVRFFSSAPLEDIEAVSEKGISVYKTQTGEISFLVHIKSLEFRKALMQEHFNENHMESDRFPTASFKGKILEQPDFSKQGEIPVKLSGILEIKGIKKKRNIPAVLEIKENKINLKTRFKVACEDHDIEIPALLWKNIAEVVEVSVNANYE